MTARKIGASDHEAIVVTGMGVVAPLGIGCRQVWQRLLEGDDAISDVESFDTSQHAAQRGGEVKGFDAASWLRRLPARQVGRATALAAAAAHEAVADAGFDRPFERPESVGVAMGTTSGEPGIVEDFDDLYLQDRLDRVAGEFIGRYPCHVIAANLAEELGCAGPNIMIPAACAAGNYALSYAFDALRTGRADVMLAGGADAFSRITYTGFARLGAIAPERCRPFDRRRQGMVPGEGAAVLVLERLSDALVRDAHIYSEVAGYGLSCDAHHMTAAHPEGAGAARAMCQALEHARIDADDVSYISAHGTGTPTNDRLETKAVQRVFRHRSNRVPVSSVKSMIGHTMGAASAIESVVCSMAVKEGRVPPTIHFETPDPECRLDCVPNTAREMRVQVAMNNAYAFGGNNASVLFRRFEG